MLSLLQQLLDLYHRAVEAIAAPLARLLCALPELAGLVAVAAALLCAAPLMLLLLLDR